MAIDIANPGVDEAALVAALVALLSADFVSADGGTALTAKTTPVPADGIVGIDSAAGDIAVEFPASFFLMPVVTDATAAPALALTHNRVDLMLTHATPVLTVSAQATTAYPEGFEVAVSSQNASTITAAAGVSINGVVASSWTIAAWPGSTVLVRTAADTWVLRGNATVV